MVRTRFAPSPTGALHLGGIRTALFVWAFARHQRGTMILRIEDTDRVQPGAVEGIIATMDWLGLGYDEGPFYQSQRMARYREVLEQMLAQGLAYRCYMPQAELDALRETQMARGEKPRYDGRWRPENVGANGLVPPPDIAPVIRFRNPDDGTVAWDDAVKGPIAFANAELDDLIVARSDWTPTYNFCVVVDDLDMRITHVIRGDDHVNNTPRQINILRALRGAVPVYAHLPTVLGEDGQKLSKRRGALPVMDYEQQGYLPEAILNFLARLGWSHGDEEVFSREQIVEWFDLAHISPAAARFNAEKLKWINHEHIKRLPAAELGERLRPFLDRAGLDPANGPGPAAVGELLRDRAATLVEMADAAAYFYRTPEVAAATLAEYVTDANRAALTELHGEFATMPWTRNALLGALKAASARHGLKPALVMMPLRMLVAGTPTTPAVDAVLALLGRETVRERMAAGLSL